MIGNSMTSKMVYYKENKSYLNQKLSAIQRSTKDRHDKWCKVFITDFIELEKGKPYCYMKY
jgi:hypothetical protein